MKEIIKFKTFSHFLAIVFILSLLSCEEQCNFFVAPNGLDSNPGTREKPFQTFAMAKEAVAKVIPSMTSDITVFFSGGVYPISETVVFNAKDTPGGDYNVIYKALDEEQPAFSGGVLVTGWTPHNDSLWKAPLKRDKKLRALYVNDKRAVMACSAKEIKAQGGWGEYIVEEGQAAWAWVNGNRFDGIKYASDDLPEITKNLFDVEIENRTTWNKNFIGVRDIIKEDEQYIIKLQQPYGAIAQQAGWNAGLGVEGNHVIHNAFELLDVPGEFYFDREEQTVYYYPRAGEVMVSATVIAPVTETLLQIEGNVQEGKVKNLVFDGLTFAHTDYGLMEIDGSFGKATIQTATVLKAFANPNWHYDVYRSYDVLPGAIIANGIENITFTRNTITHTGCEGLVMSNGVNNVQVVGNKMIDVGGSAITVGHPQHVYENDTPDLKHLEGVGVEKEKYKSGTESAPRDVLISNNFLPMNAALFNGHTPITVFFGQGITVEHNWIPNAPYTGISLGWGWCDFDGVATGSEWRPGRYNRPAVFSGKPTIVAKNNVIRANRVENTMSILYDGGGIYTLGNMPGSVIERNYVRKTEQAIYTDEGSGNIVSSKNVIESPFNNTHFADGNGRKHDISIKHYFVTEKKWDVDDRSGTVVDFVLCKASSWPAEAQEIIDNSGLEPQWNYLADHWLKEQDKE